MTSAPRIRPPWEPTCKSESWTRLSRRAVSGLTLEILLPPQTRPRSRSPLARFFPRPRRRLDFPLRHRRRILLPPDPNPPLAVHPPQWHRTRLHLPRRRRPRRARPARFRLLSEPDLDESSPRTGQPGTAQALARSLRGRARVAKIVRRARPRFDVAVDSLPAAECEKTVVVGIIIIAGMQVAGSVAGRPRLPP